MYFKTRMVVEIGENYTCLREWLMSIIPHLKKKKMT